MAEYRKLTVEFETLTEAQALALEDMFALWNYMGSIGRSRWTAFFADGDGNFQPGIKVDGRKPQRCYLTDEPRRWKRLMNVEDPRPRPDDFYLMDFDAIAWALHRDEPMPEFIPPSLEEEEARAQKQALEFQTTEHHYTALENGMACSKCGRPYEDPIHLRVASGPSENAQLGPYTE
jgi:hypothetical protein